MAGKNKLVVRMWKAGARWWNLHGHIVDSDIHPVLELARAETRAYQIARRTLPALHIPPLLHFDDTTNTSPWAIFGYVGYTSIYFDTKIRPCSYWIDGMIKVRPEFGFDEPHPRWGRVPETQCLEYTLMVLNAVTVPLHQSIYAISSGLDWTDLAAQNNTPRTYSSMVQLYQKAHTKMVQRLSDGDNNNRLQRVMSVLQKCIEALQEHASGVVLLDPVLVHMDCQPQNLLWGKDDDTDAYVISSVLDWEEAAYADPRFELLLLGRKVCANRAQAQVIWEAYEKAEPSLGPILPWLRLETVHSLCTLLLQAIFGGGRSPWETQPDLWGKITREFHRLVENGWGFCEGALDNDDSRNQ